MYYLVTAAAAAWLLSVEIQFRWAKSSGVFDKFIGVIECGTDFLNTT